MDFKGLSQSLDRLKSSGIVLSIEKTTSLQLSLVLLQKDQKFRHVKFWGVIRGIQNDYYIVQGIGEDELKNRTSYYSQDCVQWNILPHVDGGMVRKSTLLQGRFTGDPSYITEHTLTQKTGESDNAQEETTTIEMKEEDRLSAVVLRIDKETAVFPKGAYLRTSLNQVVLNKTFQGLSVEEAQQLKYYCHFKPLDENDDPKKSISQTLDFLPIISSDIPPGCWSVQTHLGGAVVLLHSLQWPGMIAYHQPLTPSFGYCYNGTGEKNTDLLFML